ncbi:MAG: superfamily protein-like exporter [Amycolatopsis sp.]|uniref:RND transporter n=1 Tax=Amycolatopsis sp. TaxID=37632 RepID=UPI00261B6649|nr:RND transporter [Amycolatopsis sp.]MCU1679978.1 superfamily protein-like exporter [Amycolatopsis sp.]
MMRVPGRRVLVVAGIVAALAFVLGGLSRSKIETGVDSFLPAHDSSVDQLNDLARSFGGDPVVVLLESSKPRTLLDEQHIYTLLKLEGHLTSLPDVAAVYGPGTTLNQVAGQVQDLLTELVGRRDSVRSQAEAQAKAAGASDTAAQTAGTQATAAFDQRYGSLIVQGLPAGLPTLGNDKFVQSVVFAQGQQPRAQWRFVVPSQNSVAVLIRPRQGADAATAQRLVTAIENTVGAAHIDASKVTISGVPVLAADVSHQVTREAPLLGGVAVAAIGLCFFCVPWTRRKRRLLPLVSTLVAIASTLAILGWAGRPLSLGVVAFLSVLLGVGSYYPTYFLRAARRRVVLTVAVATAASFATLMVSPLPFVKDLGLTLSIGVLISAGLGSLLTKLPFVDVDPEPLVQPVAKRAISRRVLVSAMVGAILLAGIGWASLPSLNLQSNFEALAGGASSLDDAKHVEDVIGSSGELSVVLTGGDVTTPAAIDWMHQAQDQLIARHGDQLRPVVSPPTLLSFLGNASTPEEINAALRLLPPYLAGAVFRDDHKVATLVFGVKMDDLSALKSLRDNITAQLAPPPPGFRVELSGLSMVAVRGEEMVSNERIISNVLGIFAASLVLVIGLRRRSDAVRAFASAALATGVGLLLLRITGVALSPITVALGSLTAAVGCEFTVLLSEAARRGRRSLRVSVLLAAATSAAGYLVLVLSGLSVIRQFGGLLAGAVLLALAAASFVVAVAPPRVEADAEFGTGPEKKELVGVS